MVGPPTTPPLIDVWDVRTLDRELAEFLAAHADLIRDYTNTEKEIFLEYDHSASGRRRLTPRPQNPHAVAFLGLAERASKLLYTRSIRAWHYSRLTDAEIEILKREGIHVSTPTTLRQRLNALVASGEITAELADELYAASPFQGDQRESRDGKFWLVSHPTATDDDGVERLLKYWGGEVASFWTEREDLLLPIAAIGRARILELAVPLASTPHAYNATKPVLAAYARSIGCVERSRGIDLYVTEALPARAVIAVHSEGETAFDQMAQGYPTTFVNDEHSYWKELTGEDN